MLPAAMRSGGDVAGDHLPAVDAVLQRDDPGVVADQRRERPRRRVGVAELHREDDHVDRADRGRVVGGARPPGSVTSPNGLSIRSPFRRIASR